MTATTETKKRAAASKTKRAFTAADDICSVNDAAARLALHPKTVLRFIREGRLKATRMGKSYRILRTDVDALAGVESTTPPLGERAQVTCIIDMPGVGPALAQKWGTTVPAALNTQRRESVGDLRADVIYEPGRAHLKVIVVGAPADAIPLIRVMKVWIEQLTDR